MSNNLTCATSPYPIPPYLSTYSGAACMAHQGLQSTEILSTCCNTTLNNVEDHNLTNWTEAGSVAQKFGQTVSHVGGLDCVFDYCNITYINAGEADKATQWFSGCVKAKFPSSVNLTQCIIVSNHQKLPTGDSFAVRVSKTGLVLLLLATVAMMV